MRGRSVWLRNSIRGGLGLAIAVFVAGYLDVQHGFWVVLAAMSVLRSSALSTGATALRAVVGTIVGFGVGAAIILVVGTGQTALWVVFPLAVWAASFAPAAISFAAGQAAFTVVVLILLNLIDPVGWRVGLIRIEDIVLGCVVSLVVGLLLWPRGASAAIGTALSWAYRTGGDYFGRAVEVVTHAGATTSVERGEVLAAGRTLDDAMRQFQVEIGGDRERLAELSKAAEGAARLRLAGDAVSSLGPEPDGTQHLLPASREVLARHTRRIVTRAHDQNGLSSPDAADSTNPDVGSEVVTTLRTEIRPGTDVGDLLKRLLWVSMYAHDLERRL